MTDNLTLFGLAILKSLEDLKVSNKKISQKSVIDNAIYKDGTKVGKTTLYKKNKETGEFIYKNLLDEITEAINEKLVKNGKPTKSQKIKALQIEIKSLKAENSRLIDQVVEQEVKLIKAQKDVGIDKHSVSSQEIEIYVLSALVSKLAPKLSNASKDAKEFMFKFELKNQGNNKVNSVTSEIEKYIKDLQFSKVISFAKDS